MSLRLLVDEDTQAKSRVALLRAAGHDVLTVTEAALNARPDVEVLARARQEGRIVLTRNCDDFRLLHVADPHHSGILAIYENPDPTKNLAHSAIVTAIANLEASGWDLAGQFVALNDWNF